MHLRREEDWRQVEALHTLIFPDDDWEEADAAWILWDEHESPRGFCTVQALKGCDEATAYMTRAGILPGVRGARLQRRMLRARERWAKEQECRVAITYATYDNWPSIANLLKSGYRFYRPLWNWGGEGVHYFWKPLIRAK